MLVIVRVIVMAVESDRNVNGSADRVDCDGG